MCAVPLFPDESGAPLRFSGGEWARTGSGLHGTIFDGGNQQQTGHQKIEEKAINEFKVNKFALAGGVAANSYLRECLNEACLSNGINFSYPRMKYCTDNAAMIAVAGYFQYIKSK